MSYAETVRNVAESCENYAKLDPVPPVALSWVAHGFTAIAEALERLLPVDACTCIPVLNGLHVDERCPRHGLTSAERDHLSATVERLYDGIDAALLALDQYTTLVPGMTYVPAVENTRRILRDLRPSVPAPTNAEVADEIDDDGHVREVNL